MVSCRMLETGVFARRTQEIRRRLHEYVRVLREWNRNVVDYRHRRITNLVDTIEFAACKFEHKHITHDGITPAMSA